MIDTRNGAARLLDFLPDISLPDETLMSLTGVTRKARRSRFNSGLMERVAEAWATPLEDITCGMCRMLVGQKLGLQWISTAAASFVIRYPRAECDLYPGDLSVISLLAWREIHDFAPNETTEMLKLDFEWLVREAAEDEWEGSILKQGVAALQAARQALGYGS